MSRESLTLWQDVTASALVGSERRPLTLPATGNRLAALLGKLDTSDPNRALLAVAGTIATYRQVGNQPARDDRALPPACEPVDLPRCSEPSNQHLKRMLNGELDEVFPEWLDALNRAGRRVPEESLVSLLEWYGKKADLRERILPVLGRRGLWLAAQNPAWNDVREASAPPATDWETGSRGERLSLLKHLRATDPARGREAVASTWQKDSTEERAGFLEVFANGLSLDDEPFLEAALDDRRKEVRRIAADLLARLPGSQLVERMKARLVPLVRATGGKKPTLEIGVPGDIDKAATRDGVEPKPAGSARGQHMGEQAWRIYQLLACIPPSVWSERLSLSAGELMKAGSKSDWKLVLMNGWAAAAALFRDQDWAEALLNDPPGRTWLGEEEAKGLLLTLPLERRESIVLARLRQDEAQLKGDHPAAPLLRACQHAWSVDFARAVLERVRTSLTRDKSYGQWHFTELLPRFGLSIPPALALEVAEAWRFQPETSFYWTTAAEKMLSILQFRQEMLTELAS